MKRLLIAFLLSSGLPIAATAQGDFHIFPTFVDGRAADGTFYRSTLMVMPYNESDAPECTLSIYGMFVQFEGTGYRSTFTLSVPADGSTADRTTGAQGLATGYATLTCDEWVYATLLYSYYAPNGVKVGEATVFSTEIEQDVYRMVVDQRDGAQLGIAIANNTDIQRSYDLFLVSNGVTRTASVTVPARQSLSRFLNQLVNAPANAVGTLTILSRDFADFSAIGLRFTGPTFTTIPANR